MSAKSSDTMTIDKPTEHELVITRVFAASRQLVWQAWTQSEHLMRWSCPKDFTLLFCEGDLQVGGAWRAGMRSPDGEEFVMGGKYREPQRQSVWNLRTAGKTMPTGLATKRLSPSSSKKRMAARK